MEIVSKRKFLKYYFIICLIFLLLIILIVLVFLFISNLNKISIGTILGIFLISLFFFIFYNEITIFLKGSSAQLIKIKKNTIFFGKSDYYFLDDIQDISLIGSDSFLHILPRINTTIQFKNGKIKYIVDDFYTNIGEIKSCLYQIVVLKTTYIKFNTEPISKSILKNILKSNNFQRYKGQKFFCLQGIASWLLPIIFVFKTINLNNPSFHFILISFCLIGLFFILFSRHLHYFILTNEYLVVKNHNFIWKEHFFKLSDIQEVKIEKAIKATICLRIITNDFKNKLYPAASLNIEHWLKIKKTLENNGISVKSENVI